MKSILGTILLVLLSFPTPSQALEEGADAVLVNTAIAQAADPALMGESFRLGVEAGRKAYLAGRIDRRREATPSSPMAGVATSMAAGS